MLSGGSKFGASFFDEVATGACTQAFDLSARRSTRSDCCGAVCSDPLVAVFWTMDLWWWWSKMRSRACAKRFDVSGLLPACTNTSNKCPLMKWIASIPVMMLIDQVRSQMIWIWRMVMISVMVKKWVFKVDIVGSLDNKD